MNHILEFSDFFSNGDRLNWGEQIRSEIQRNLVGKEFKEFTLDSVRIVDAKSESNWEDFGSGIIELDFKKTSPDELDQLMSDLSDVGLSGGRTQKIKYEISGVMEDQEEYDISAKIYPIGSPSEQKETNFFGVSPASFYSDASDISMGVGKIILRLVKTQLLK
jgi:hypothetical protein